MGPVISNHNKWLIILSVIQLSGGHFSKNVVENAIECSTHLADLTASVLMRNFSSLKLVMAVGLVFTVLEMVVEYILVVRQRIVIIWTVIGFTVGTQMCCIVKRNTTW